MSINAALISRSKLPKSIGDTSYYAALSFLTSTYLGRVYTLLDPKRAFFFGLAVGAVDGAHKKTLLNSHSHRRSNVEKLLDVTKTVFANFLLSYIAIWAFSLLPGQKKITFLSNKDIKLYGTHFAALTLIYNATSWIFSHYKNF